jgi:transposase
MRLYSGIDLHSNNSVVVVIDEQDRVVYERRHPNDLGAILSALSPYAETLAGIAVESTFNWYWLVDGLMEAGFQVHLANTARMQEYGGLKYTDDHHDARWLAHMLRLGVLPQGYIYPAQERAVRDLLRKRGQLVRQRTVQILSLQNLLSRNLGQQLSGNRIKGLDEQALSELLPVAEQHLAAGANLAVMRALDGQIEHLEQEIKARVKPRPALKWLKTVAGIGDILGWTILLEAGDIARFAHVGNYASYCRCVESKRLSNGKKKGENNRKNGNKYLAWAYVEAANFAIRYHDPVKGFYQRKKAKTNGVVAIKAVAHKLARASYYVMRDRVAFDIHRAFS